MKKIFLVSILLLAAAGCNTYRTENRPVFREKGSRVSDEAKPNQPDPSLAQYYNSKYQFDLRYPKTFEIEAPQKNNTDWSNNLTGKGLRVATIKIPQSFEPQTNFVEGKLDVGVSSDPKILGICVKAAETEQTEGKESLNGTIFYKFSSEGAAAGNYYQTKAYRGIYMSKCYSLEETVHSANIYNFDPSMGISEFNYGRVRDALEMVVHSFDLH